MVAQAGGLAGARDVDTNSTKTAKELGRPQPFCVGSKVFARFRRNPACGLERLHVGSLPALGALHYVELHGLTFLQALETTRVDRRVMHEDIFAVLTRNEAKTLRIVKPLHGALFHWIVFPGLN